MSFIERVGPAIATSRLDLEAIKRSNPIPAVAARAGLKLIRAGNEYKACCPFHEDRTPSFTIYKAGLRWCCFGGCGDGDVFDFMARHYGVGLREAAAMLDSANLPSVHVEQLPPVDDNERVDEALAIWGAAIPATGTLVETYLRSRGLHLPIPESIRFASLPYGKRGPQYPCLVAAIASSEDRLTGIQRTYLAADGTGKLQVAKPKLSLGRVSGGAIRLAACARSLVVTEGLEDGLTLQQELGQAVWVAAGASMMPSMRFPAGVQSVAIGGDGDETGERQAHKAAKAFAARGIQARMFFPIGAKDFNDELTGRIAA